MGNYISKISKDRLLAFEEFMKNKTSFEKGRKRPSLDRLTRETYTRIHSIQGLSKRLAHYKVACGGEPFFTRFADRRRFFLHCEIRRWYDELVLSTTSKDFRPVLYIRFTFESVA